MKLDLIELKKDYILYLGNYLDEKIISERQLPTNNIAGTNRIHRLSLALSVHFNPLIISPGVSLRLKRNTKVFLKSKIHRKDDIKVFYASSVGISYLSVLISYITYFFSFFKILHKTKAKSIIVYNFDPLLLCIVFFVKIGFPKVKIYNNIEDISIPRLSDFNRKSEDRGLQQYIFFLCMKCIAIMAHGYIIPTRRFVKYLPKKKNILVITGCISVKENFYHTEKDKLSILFAGKIEFEHGIDVFISALELLKKTPYAAQLKIDISGGGNKKEWLENELVKFTNIDITYHGFVNNQHYNKLLYNSDVCVALQKDSGRHAQFKTPSKVYEYLGNAKVVIATDVGDLAEIQYEYIKICKPLSPENLKENIIHLIKNKSMIAVTKEKVHGFAKITYDSGKIGNLLSNFITKG